MSHTLSSDRLAAALERAGRQWEATLRHDAEAAPARPARPFVVAISREAGAGGALVAEAVGTRLGWPVYDRELLERIAEEMGVRPDLLRAVDERRKSWLQEWAESFSFEPPISAPGFACRVAETMLSLAAQGECVLVGRGAAQILPPETTLRVRLVAPVGYRVLAIRQRLNLSPEEAARWVERTDRERDRFVKDHYHKDPAEARLYDLVLNSSRFDVPACTNLVVEALQHLQAQRAAHAAAPRGECRLG